MTPSFRNDLVTWFEAHARVLPWRSRPTPYRVWISEIMLQQTRVETVRDYFTRFVRHFPSLKKLAEAQLDDVLELWSGLGYYRRARMLHAAARQIVDRHAGRFPKQRADVMALPGVGKYTTGAILSIAFNQPEPIVDGNIERVFARLARVPGNVKSKDGSRRIWELASEHVTRGHEEGHSPSSMNQALMELGATVCTPQSPACGSCPVHAHCAAFAQGDVLSFPVLPQRAKPKHKRYLFAGVRNPDGRILMLRRHPEDNTSLLPNGLWELPHVEWEAGGLPLNSLREICGIDLATTGTRITRKHAIMNYRLTLVAQPATTGARGTSNGTRAWFKPQEALQAPVASATRKLLAAML